MFDNSTIFKVVIKVPVILDKLARFAVGFAVSFQLLQIDNCINFVVFCSIFQQLKFLYISLLEIYA